MKILTLLKIISATVIILIIATISTLIVALNAVNDERITRERQAEFAQLGLDLSSASEFLTTSARIYVMTGDIRAYNAYMQEVQVTRTRENVIARLEQLGAPENELDLVRRAAESSNALAELENRAFMAVASGNLEEAQRLMFGAEYDELRDPILRTMEDFQNVMNARAERETQDQQNIANLMFTLQTASVFVLTAAVLGSILLISIKLKPIKSLVEASKEITNGNLNVNIAATANDEIGDLRDGLVKVVGSITFLIDEMNVMSKEQKNGNFEYLINVENLNGCFKNVAEAINSAMSSYVLTVSEALECLQSFERGEFSVNEKSKPREASNKTMNTIDSLRDGMVYMNNQINAYVSAALAGNLSYRADTSEFKGDWAKIILGLNEVFEAISKPIHESNEVLQEVAKGNFDVEVKGNYNGDFSLIKNALNDTMEVISSYIIEIIGVLEKLAENNLDQNIDRDYIGQFSNIKISLNKIVRVLNKFMLETKASSEDVATGTQQISDSSAVLAAAFARQVNTVTNIAASLSQINDQSRSNVEKAVEANDLSEKLKQNAFAGSEEMDKMLSSMNEIKESSDKISDIIKVLESIASQTDLLALNAAVEAARVGEHGKGFAVVAGEVRNLALRSQQAVKDSIDMVEQSIENVTGGMMVANNTALALEKIVSDVTNISSIIEQIKDVSTEQATNISGVAGALGGVLQTVNNNAAIAKNTASISEKFAGQSEVLRAMVGKFTLKSQERD